MAQDHDTVRFTKGGRDLRKGGVRHVVATFPCDARRNRLVWIAPHRAAVGRTAAAALLVFLNIFFFGDGSDLLQDLEYARTTFDRLIEVKIKMRRVF